MKEIGYEDFMTIDTAMSQSLSVINGATCVIGSLGNMTLLAVILLHKQLHGASELLLMSLALADFVSCAIYLPLLLVRLNTSEKLPTVMNQSRRAIGQAAVVCVSLNLLTLTADRLIFFYRPLRYAYWMRRKVVIIIIMTIYVISLAVGLYAYYDMIKSQYPKIVFVGVPMLVFFLLHYGIYRLAAAHQSQVANQQLSVQYNYHVTSTTMLQARRNVHTVMLFGILYLITWLPVTIFQLWTSVTDHHDPSTFQKYFYLLLTIQQISAAIDPYLCCYRNNKVKAVFQKLLPIHKHVISGKGITLENTASFFCADGLNSSESSPGKSTLCVGKQVMTVAKSLENMKTSTDIDYLDKILELTIAGKPALNAYQGMEDVNKTKALQAEKRDKIFVECNLDEFKDLSTQGKPALNITESAESTHHTKMSKDMVGKTMSVSMESTINQEIDRSTEDKHTINLSESLGIAKAKVVKQSIDKRDGVSVESNLEEDISSTTGKQQDLIVTESANRINNSINNMQE